MNTSRQVHSVLAELRTERGLRQSDVAEFLMSRGVEASQRSVSNWECGRTQPNADAFIALCELYGVRDVLEVFLGVKGSLSGLNALGRQRVEEYIRLLSADAEFSSRPHKVKNIRRLPLYDLPVSAGTGQFLDSSSYELLDVDDSVPISADFAVRIAGDSMSPNYEDGQYVYVCSQDTLEDGELGIFLLNGNAYFKKLRSDDGTRLVSFNRAYSPIDVHEYDDLRVIGKVVK